MLGEQPGNAAYEGGQSEGKRWFEKEPLATYARVTYKPNPETSPLTVVDIPLMHLLPPQRTQPFIIIGTNMQVRVTEEGKWSSKYATLSDFLYNYNDPVTGLQGIIVPEDSPVRALPDIKYALPPPADTLRVAIKLTEEQRTRLETRRVFASALTIAEVSLEQIKQIDAYFREETEELLRQLPYDPHKKYKPHHPPEVRKYLDMLDRHQGMKQRRWSLSLLPSEIQRLGIKLDPEAPGYKDYMALQP